MTEGNKIRESVAAGSFYPDSENALRNKITSFLNNIESPVDIKNIKSIISPHAGYVYSGQVAAYSYRQLTGKKFDSIFVIAPSHSEYFSFISIFNGDAFRTPLGLLYIDKEKSKILAEKSPYIKLSEQGHLNEHSLEVQLPFIQVLYKDIKIVPIVMGQQNSRNISALGNSIGELFKDDNILIIASTDLSHYHPYDTAVTLDSRVKELVNAFDVEHLTAGFLNNTLEMCGGGPVISAMIASKLMGANKSRILDYKNSGDIIGDKSAVVGYMSTVIYRE
ncbi:MAG: AmmeMemoRadiSam system protein B [Actinomycetota bacterium]|nr:AmmeMemoRadiSam system protein B [Actinomycetota bacterium]